MPTPLRPPRRLLRTLGMLLLGALLFLAPDFRDAGAVAALRYGGHETRESAARLLGNWEADAGVPELRRALQDPVAEVRSAAVIALGTIGPGIGREAIDEVLQCVNDFPVFSFT